MLLRRWAGRGTIRAWRGRRRRAQWTPGPTSWPPPAPPSSPPQILTPRLLRQTPTPPRPGRALSITVALVCYNTLVEGQPTQVRGFRGLETRVLSTGLIVLVCLQKLRADGKSGATAVGMTVSVDCALRTGHSIY